VNFVCSGNPFFETFLPLKRVERKAKTFENAQVQNFQMLFILE
jgi:hypothetical protein